MNLPNFWYGSCFNSPLWENHTLYDWKILIWQTFGHLRRKFCHFLAKIVWFESFLPTQLWIFLICAWNFFEFWLFPGNQSYWVLLNFADFWYRNLSYSLLLENWCLQSEKKLAPPNSGYFCSKFAPFWPKISIFACISRTVHWILLIFGIETYLKVFFWKIDVYSPGKI